MIRAQLITQRSGHVLVLRRFGFLLVEDTQHQIEEAAATGYQPAASFSRKRALSQQMCVRKTCAEREARAILTWRPQRNVHHAAAFVAVARGESASQEFDTIDGVDVDDAQGAVIEILQVEGLVQFQSVEENQRFVGATAAYRELRAVVTGRQTGEARHRPKHVFAERC